MKRVSRCGIRVGHKAAGVTPTPIAHRRLSRLTSQAPRGVPTPPQAPKPAPPASHAFLRRQWSFLRRHSPCCLLCRNLPRQSATNLQAHSPPSRKSRQHRDRCCHRMSRQSRHSRNSRHPRLPSAGCQPRKSRQHRLRFFRYWPRQRLSPHSSWDGRLAAEPAHPVFQRRRGFPSASVATPSHFRPPPRRYVPRHRCSPSHRRFCGHCHICRIYRHRRICNHCSHRRIYSHCFYSHCCFYQHYVGFVPHMH